MEKDRIKCYLEKKNAIDLLECGDFFDQDSIVGAKLKLLDDVKPVARGKWIEKKAKDGQRYLQCSVCGNNKMDMTYNDFCKFCGADMREVRE